MPRKTSPFAALTSEQKQIKWMEYQSIRLPYTEAVPPPVETEMHPACESVPPAAHAQSNVPTAEKPTVMPPPEVYMQRTPANAGAAMQMNQQKTRHHQYDAVIARMKQAELLAGNYYHCSEHTGKHSSTSRD